MRLDTGAGGSVDRTAVIDRAPATVFPVSEIVFRVVRVVGGRARRGTSVVTTGRRSRVDPG